MLEKYVKTKENVISKNALKNIVKTKTMLTSGNDGKTSGAQENLRKRR